MNTCRICHRSAREVPRLVIGHDVCICSDCLHRLAEEDAKARRLAVVPLNSNGQPCPCGGWGSR